MVQPPENVAPLEIGQRPVGDRMYRYGEDPSMKRERKSCGPFCGW